MAGLSLNGGALCCVLEQSSHVLSPLFNTKKHPDMIEKLLTGM